MILQYLTDRKCAIRNCSFKLYVFYKFFDFSDCVAWKLPLMHLLANHDLRGTVLLSPEGINGMVSGTDDGLHLLMAQLRAIPGLERLEARACPAEAHPFKRAYVKVKKEIIAFDYPLMPAQPHARALTPCEWNKLLAERDIFLLDARNAYESACGSFKGAVTPDIRSFKGLKTYMAARPPQTKPIAMFCTGGIRCEKLSAWLHAEGYAELYQLEGGILRYLAEIPEEESRWQGECFVFDARAAVGHGLKPSTAL